MNYETQESYPINPSPEPVRESPAPEPLHCGLDDPSHPDASDEPVLNIDNIQGNILAPFMKDHQAHVFLTLEDGKIEDFKAWLAAIRPFIATVAEVITFNRLFKEIRTRRKCEPTGVKATWINIAFSIDGINKLADESGLDTDFEDEAFTQGLAHRSLDGILGDPSSDDQTDAEGHPRNWVLGGIHEDGSKKKLDVVVIIASDDEAEVDEANPNSTISQIRNGSDDMPGLNDFGDVIVEQGRNLPADKDLAGHEHFGFLDGVSQPGVRGRLSDDPHDVLTPRQNPNDRDQGKPGQELIWPGEFVFGYPQGPSNPQDEEDPTFQSPGPISAAGPEWANDGSFLVFRRLRQDVATFHNFLKSTAEDLDVPEPPELQVPAPPGTPVGDSAADVVGARLVGRWRSGAPVLRTRHPEVQPDGTSDDDDELTNDQDNPFLAKDDCANNNFEFQESTEPLPHSALRDPFDCADENDPEFQSDSGDERPFQPAHKDKAGLVCPFTGHIRKVYPRDDKADRAALDSDGNEIVTVDGKPELALDQNKDSSDIDLQPVKNEEGEEIVTNENDTQTHRILRRGIPFGDPLLHDDGRPSTPGDPAEDDGVDRGLLFLAYQTSIVDQFEFILKNWANNRDFKEPSDPDQDISDSTPDDPGYTRKPDPQELGGHDPIIGQNNKPNADGDRDRVREFTVTFQDDDGNRVAARVSTESQPEDQRDWVIPTGGEYFFSPSIDALGKLAGAD